MSTSAPTYIDSIELENWRQYKGVQEIPLQPDDTRSINALIGENGTGKTNLAKAVQVCLNGSVPGENSDAEDEEPHVNSEVFEQIGDGEAVSGKIRLNLTHKGTDYEITREFASRNEDGECINTISSDLTVQRHDPPGGWEEVENPSKMLSSILPPEVQRYYFFDAERLDALFQEGDYEDDVRDAVWELSHVDVLENAIEHLGTLRDERRRKAKSTSGEVQDARDKRDEKEAERLDTLHEEAQVVRSIEKKEAALEEIEKQMGAAANQEVLDLIEERGEVEAKIDGLIDKEDEFEGDLERLLIEAGPICLATEALETAAEKFDEMGARNELPPAVRRKYLNGLLEDETCLCGCDLNKRPDHRQNVKNLRDSTPEINDRLIEASYDFPDTLTTGEEKFAELRKTKRELRKTTRDRLKKEEKTEELTEQLRGHDIPDDVDLQSLDQDREQLRSDLRKLRNQQGRLEEKIETIETKIESIKQRIERELEKDKRSQELMAEVKWYKQARDELQAIKEELMAEVRDDIERSLDTYYNELTWKDEEYDITVKDDFSIRIDGPDGRRQVDRLSMGETELLALSFIAALTEVSGFDAPVLIDTPVGRIDQEHRASIGEKLPDYLSNQQVTFLFTDSEFDDTVSSSLADHLANTYKLNNDNRVTIVEAC